MYPIDLQTILRVLSHQSGELRASVPQFAGFKDACQASVTFSMGKVLSCAVYHAGTRVLFGEEAFRALVSKGTLEWEYIPASESPATPAPPAQMSPRLQASPESVNVPPSRQVNEESILPSMVPLQLQRVRMEELATWPRPYRFVYQLSTGEKTVAEIAQLLSLTPRQISTVLVFLVRRGLISLQ